MKRVISIGLLFVLIVSISGCNGSKNEIEQTSRLESEPMDIEQPIDEQVNEVSIVEEAGVLEDQTEKYETEVITISRPDPNRQEEIYADADALFRAGTYIVAVDLFRDLGDYKDSVERKFECCYFYAKDMLAAGNYEAAFNEFEALGDFRDSPQMLDEVIYQHGLKQLENGEYVEALDKLTSLTETYDVAELIRSTHYMYGSSLLDMKDYFAAIEQFELADGIENSAEMITEAKYHIGYDLYDKGLYEECIVLLEEFPTYQNSSELIKDAKYLLASQWIAENNFSMAREIFIELGDYRDSRILEEQARMASLPTEPFSLLEFYKPSFVGGSRGWKYWTAHDVYTTIFNQRVWVGEELYYDYYLDQYRCDTDKFRYWVGRDKTSSDISRYGVGEQGMKSDEADYGQYVFDLAQSYEKISFTVTVPIPKKVYFRLIGDGEELGKYTKTGSYEVEIANVEQLVFEFGISDLSVAAALPQQSLDVTDVIITPIVTDNTETPLLDGE